MLLRQPLEHPVRGGVLGADDAGRNRRPDTGECQDHIAGVRVEVLEEAGDPLENRADAWCASNLPKRSERPVRKPGPRAASAPPTGAAAMV